MSVVLGRTIIVKWHEMDRWVVPSAALLSRRLPADWTPTRIGDCVNIVSNAIKVKPYAE